AKLEMELQNLLDPEGVLPKPLWREEDLFKPPGEIDDAQVTKIAKLLHGMMKMRDVIGPVTQVNAMVQKLFERSLVLPNAPKLAFRICTLYAFVQAKFKLDRIKLPEGKKEPMEDVLDWLKTDGAG